MTDNGDSGANYLERSELLRLVNRDVLISGDEPTADVIMREPSLLIPVGEPANPPLDLHTYRVRLSRWEAGDGPNLVGMSELVSALESLNEPACAVSVSGVRTNYVFVLDAGLTRILASVAIDPPD